MTDKKALRSELIAARDGIPAELHAELSAAVCRNILSMPEYAACDTLLGYCPIGSEWDIRPVLRNAAASGRRIALPRCDRASHTMTFFIISSEEDIEIGEYGIPAPRIGCPAYIDTPQALCLVPALCTRRARQTHRLRRRLLRPFSPRLFGHSRRSDIGAFYRCRTSDREA